jgi:RNA polymerase sigma-70 factor (ECF subfamily)
MKPSRYTARRSNDSQARTRRIRNVDATCSRNTHALWRSLAGFDRRCSLRTWVYRVAHNTATSQVIGRRVHTPTLVSLDDVDAMAADVDNEAEVDQLRVLERIHQLIHALVPLDQQVILLYLEGLDAGMIGEITGLSSGNVATKVRRIKKILSERFHEGARHGR